MMNTTSYKSKSEKMFLKRQARAKQRAATDERVKHNRIEKFKKETDRRKELHQIIEEKGPLVLKRDIFPNEDLLIETKKIAGPTKTVLLNKKRRK